MSEYRPLFIHIGGKKVVVFGGGSVGERKARFFKGSDLTVVSAGFTPALEAMALDGTIKVVRKSVKPEDIKGLIEGAFLVVAATSDAALNEAIARESVAMGALANSATGEGPVIIPSVVKKGDVEIAISTGGKSPAMAKFLRKWLESAMGAEIEQMIELQKRVRETLKASVHDQKKREHILTKILEDPDVWDALEASPDVAYELAMRHMR